MKRVVFMLAIVFVSLVVGFLVGQKQSTHSINSNKNSSEQIILNEIRKNCRIADEMGKIYFSKYGGESGGKEPTNSPEWVDAQSWEQACSDSFETLREQFRNEK